MDDCDQNKILKISKTLWQDTASTNVNITNKHGVRAGARSVTIGICNFYEMAVDFKPESIRRRVFMLLWKDMFTNLSTHQKEVTKEYMEKYLNQFKGTAILFFKELNLKEKHLTYYHKLMKMYSKFTDIKRLHKIVPQSMLQFQTIIYQMVEIFCYKIICCNPDIINITFENIIKDTFKVYIYVSILLYIKCKYS